MEIDRKIEDFSRLGEIFRLLSSGEPLPENWDSGLVEAVGRLKKEAESAYLFNPWFIRHNVLMALGALGAMLTTENLTRWIQQYPLIKHPETRKGVNIGVIMAGNIPLVGFHDFLCVLMSGNKLTGKLSSDDARLLPAVVSVLTQINPAYQDMIALTQKTITGFEAIIATGSNNTSRYFEYYFGKYPHIIRKSRYSAAILTGTEKKEEWSKLGFDLFSYFGLGCRNVSTLLVPQQFDVRELFAFWTEFSRIAEHDKYRNNYIYRKTVLEMTGTPYTDNGYCIFAEKDKTALASPIAMVNIIRYSDPLQIEEYITTHRPDIQCIVTSKTDVYTSVAFGQSQYPSLWDYADGIDTMTFMTELKK